MKIISGKDVAEATGTIDEFMRKEFSALDEILVAEKKPPEERSELEKRLAVIPTIAGSGLFEKVARIKRELTIENTSR